MSEERKYYEGTITVRTGERCSICLLEMEVTGYVLGQQAIFTKCPNGHVDSGKEKRKEMFVSEYPDTTFTNCNL